MVLPSPSTRRSEVWQFFPCGKSQEHHGQNHTLQKPAQQSDDAFLARAPRNGSMRLRECVSESEEIELQTAAHLQPVLRKVPRPFHFMKPASLTPCNDRARNLLRGSSSRRASRVSLLK